MPREKAAERKAREALEREEEQKRKEAFQATLPLKLLQLLAKAQARHDVNTSVHDDPVGGLRVNFAFPPPPPTEETYCGEGPVEHTLYHLSSEPYEVDAVEWEFKRLEDEARAAAEKRRIAQDVYDRLTPEEREATGLRRPS
jgi:hypothetical protein